MTSHEYANRLKEIAEFLLSRPAFEVANMPLVLQMYYDKDKFLAAALSLGSGKKEFTDGSWPEVKFFPDACPEIRLSIPRDKVCRKVQDVVWECEPFLSPEEEATLSK